MSHSFKLEDVFSVAGKVVLVTGGGTGLGKAIAQGFASNGAKVYITGRRAEMLDKAVEESKAMLGKGGAIIPIQGDVATKEGCGKIAKEVESKEKVLDALINCAGVGTPWRKQIKDHNNVQSLLWDGVEDEDFTYTNQININGVYFMTAAFVPLLRKAEDPSVVIIASIAGLANQRTMGSVWYGTSKAGAIQLAKLLAGRLHPTGIRVNTICPGIFPSEMTGTSSGGHEYDLQGPAAKAAKRSTSGRPGRPEEIVGPTLMLCSKGGSYMNHAVLTVDGGRLMGAGINDGIRMPEDSYV